MRVCGLLDFYKAMGPPVAFTGCAIVQTKRIYRVLEQPKFCYGTARFKESPIANAVRDYYARQNLKSVVKTTFTLAITQGVAPLWDDSDLEYRICLHSWGVLGSLDFMKSPSDVSNVII